MKLSLLFPAALLVACSASPETASESSRATTTTNATIEFAKDWSVTQTGTIDPSHPLRFRYDLDRLSKCRAVEYGQPAWTVLAYVSFDGRAPTTLVLAPQHGQTSGIVETTIPVSVASDVAFWFYASDDHGCVEWDSQFGENFHFSIAKAPVPTVRFGGDWQSRVEGEIGPGTVLVDYDLARAPCRSTYNGNDAFSVILYASIDGQTPTTQDMVTQVDARDFATPRFVSLPQGHHTLSMWFENSDAYGCHTWDSDYGANYAFAY